MTKSSQDRQRQALASSRDRVLDAVKAFALAVVVLGHSAAWDVSSGTAASVLDNRPALAWLTWTLQVLPLFFAAGAVGNLASWRRQPRTAPFLQRRLHRLVTPALLYASVWTAILLPIAVVAPQAEQLGRFLSQLLWFLGVYAAVVLAVPMTSRWVAHPGWTLVPWLAVIVAIDVLRWNAAPVVGWFNLLLVWGWLHQLGYYLPVLRRWPRARLLVLAAIALGIAVGLAFFGPYSSSLVSFVGDPEPSNLAPPTMVVALYGLAQVLVLAAVWPWLARLLANDRTWLAVAAFGSRAVEIYLWHIQGVALVAVTALALGFTAEPLGALWWLAHAFGFGAVVALAWCCAGIAASADRRLSARSVRHARHAAPVLPFAMVVPLVLLSITATGFGTWWGTGMLGLPASSALNLFVLAGAWWALARGPGQGMPRQQPLCETPTDPCRG
ncbi:MAG TPA: acyltransferase [Pseudonocardiaceae bacterium]|nr:acyltransferase [Pseudonocardiaceae bacterium]